MTPALLVSAVLLSVFWWLDSVLADLLFKRTLSTVAYLAGDTVKFEINAYTAQDQKHLNDKQFRIGLFKARRFWMDKLSTTTDKLVISNLNSASGHLQLPSKLKSGKYRLKCMITSKPFGIEKLGRSMDFEVKAVGPLTPWFFIGGQLTVMHISRKDWNIVTVHFKPGSAMKTKRISVKAIDSMSGFNFFETKQIPRPNNHAEVDIIIPYPRQSFFVEVYHGKYPIYRSYHLAVKTNSPRSGKEQLKKSTENPAKQPAEKETVFEHRNVKDSEVEKNEYVEPIVEKPEEILTENEYVEPIVEKPEEILTENVDVAEEIKIPNVATKADCDTCQVANHPESSRSEISNSFNSVHSYPSVNSPISPLPPDDSNDQIDPDESQFWFPSLDDPPEDQFNFPSYPHVIPPENRGDYWPSARPVPSSKSSDIENLAKLLERWSINDESRKKTKFKEPVNKKLKVDDLSSRGNSGSWFDPKSTPPKRSESVEQDSTDSAPEIGYSMREWFKIQVERQRARAGRRQGENAAESRKSNYESFDNHFNKKPYPPKGAESIESQDSTPEIGYSAREWFGIRDERQRARAARRQTVRKNAAEFGTHGPKSYNNRFDEKYNQPKRMDSYESQESQEFNESEDSTPEDGYSLREWHKIRAARASLGNSRISEQSVQSPDPYPPPPTMRHAHVFTATYPEWDHAYRDGSFLRRKTSSDLESELSTHSQGTVMGYPVTPPNSRKNIVSLRDLTAANLHQLMPSESSLESHRIVCPSCESNSDSSDEFDLDSAKSIEASIAVLSRTGSPGISQAV